MWPTFAAMPALLCVNPVQSTAELHLSAAAGTAKDPFTLVYAGALTKNEPGRVNIHPTTYKLDGLDISANVYTPGPILYSGDANLTDEQIAKLPFELYRQGYEYYWKTHAHPNSTFKYTTSSLVDLMGFDATDHIELIDQPLLMIAGSKADSLYMTEDAFAKATGTKDKELFKIDGATHIETYWVPKYVDTAMKKLTAFFTTRLGE
jgi:hypothetical protein